MLNSKFSIGVRRCGKKNQVIQDGILYKQYNTQ